MLKITNNGDFSLVDRYDGQEYGFPAGKTVRCPLDVAKHIFGVGDPNKAPYLTRLGWLRNTGDMTVAMEKLNNFSFEMVEEKFSEEFALIEHGKPSVQQVDPVEKSEADDLGYSSGAAPTKHTTPRNILKRLEQAPA